MPMGARCVTWREANANRKRRAASSNGGKVLPGGQQMLKEARCASLCEAPLE